MKQPIPPSVALAIALMAHACSDARSTEVAPGRAPLWAPVYSSEDHWVALDTANVVANEDGSYRVWFETRHGAEREQDGRRYNRELIQSLLRCEQLAFKTVSVSMSLEDGPVVHRRGGSLADAEKVPWRTVRPGTVDLPSMTKACTLLRAER